MRDFLASVPLLGWGPLLVVGAVALVFLALAAVVWRRRPVLRWVFGFLGFVFVLATAGGVVNDKYAYYATLADVFGVPTYPTGDIAEATATGKEHPEGLVVDLPVPDTASGFGDDAAKVFLPPQYFTQESDRFPVAVLLHGNPGSNTDWLSAGGAADTGLAVSKDGTPVILVMPNVLQNDVTGESLCVDSKLEGNAETYVVQDVVAATDTTFRTVADAAHRTLGGLSMGGFCALNLGLKHPDVFSVALDFSGETKPEYGGSGGNEALFGGGADWQATMDADDPQSYAASLTGSKGPAIWMDCGTGDPGPLAQMQALLPTLQQRGFTVELHTRPGGHSFATWTAALQQALPWAAQRMGAATT